MTHPWCWPDVQRGGERLFDDLASWLAAAGHDVLTVSTSAAASRSSSGTRTDLRFATPRRDPAVAYLPRAAVAVRRFRPDVMHGLFHLDGVAGRLAGAPHVVHVQGMPLRHNLERRRWHRRLFGPSVAHAAQVVAVSQAAADALEAELGVPAVAMHNGVRTADFAGGGPRHDVPTILFPGDPVDPRKRLDVLVEALVRLRPAWPELRLAIASPVGGATAALLRNRLGDTVDLLAVSGPGGMPAAYARAWVTCLPAVREAFGLVFVESMAAGRPAVGVRDGGVPEVIDDARWLAAPDDADDLAVALDRALHDADDVGMAARCVAMAARFDWSVRGPAFEALYRDVSSG